MIAQAKRDTRNLEATRQTLRKRRRDEILFLFERGCLAKHHVIAAEAIEDTWTALNRGGSRVCMVYEPREYDTPKKYGGKTPMERMTPGEAKIYRNFYVPWAEEMNVKIPAKGDVTILRLVLDVVVDNMGVAQLEKIYGTAEGNRVVGKFLKRGLRRYADIAGIDVIKNEVDG